MNDNCIYNVDLITNNNERISLSSDIFNNFYIANIDEFGDEISYDKEIESNVLFANFFMIRIINNEIMCNSNIINKISDKKNITKVSINFTNGKIQEIELPKKRVLNNGIINNKYVEFFKDSENLCIIVTDKKIKNKKNLFA